MAPSNGDRRALPRPLALLGVAAAGVGLATLARIASGHARTGERDPARRPAPANGAANTGPGVRPADAPEALVAAAIPSPGRLASGDTCTAGDGPPTPPTRRTPLANHAAATGTGRLAPATLAPARSVTRRRARPDLTRRRPPLGLVRLPHPAAFLVAAALVLAGTVVVYGHWTAGGSGSATGSTATLAAPVVAGTAGAGTATLGWSAVTAPGGGIPAYYVTRSGGVAGDCPTPAAPRTVLTCTDSGLAKGTYDYTVTAVWHSWTATSPAAASVTLASGALHHLVLAAATTTPVAGATDLLTVTASDVAGNTVALYTGSHSLTFAGASSIANTVPTVTNASGTAVAFGTPTALTFNAGVSAGASAGGGRMRLYKAETASITVSEAGATTSSALAVTVSGAAIASFTVAAPAAPVAGVSFSASLAAKDAYGNTADYTGSQCVAFSGPASSPGGTAPAYPARGGCSSGQSAVTFSAGTASATVTLSCAETTKLVATDGPSGSSGSTAISVTAAAVSKLRLEPATTTPVAGAADNLVISAVDAYRNTVTSYTGAHSLTFAGASSILTNAPTVTNASGAATAFGSATSISFGAGVATVSGSGNGVMRLYKAETASLTVSEAGAYTSTPVQVTVSGAAIASFTVTTPSAQVAGIAFSVAVAAKDAYGNAAAYTGTQCVAFTGPASSPNGTAPAYPARGSCATGQSAVTFSAGSASVPVTLSNASAATTLTATDGPTGKTGSTGTFAVAVGAFARLVLAAASTTPVAGAADSLTITATDVGGNTVTGYTGSHSLTFAGASTSGPYAPTVSNATGSAIAFGSATSIAFTSGVAAVSGTANGVMRLYRLETAPITVSESGNATSAALAVTPHLPAGLGIKVQYRNYDAPAPSDNQAKPGITVVNSGSIAFSTDVVSIRYWFTGDGGASTYAAWCDYAPSCASLVISIAAVSPARAGADHYLLLDTDVVTTLGPGATSGDTQLRFNKTDFSVLNELDDYSYGSGTSYADSTKLTAYWYGNLVWGTEP